MAEIICTPFWSSFNRTEEKDFCIEEATLSPMHFNAFSKTPGLTFADGPLKDYLTPSQNASISGDLPICSFVADVSVFTYTQPAGRNRPTSVMIKVHSVDTDVLGGQTEFRIMVRFKRSNGTTLTTNYPEIRVPASGEEAFIEVNIADWETLLTEEIADTSPKYLHQSPKTSSKPRSDEIGFIEFAYTGAPGSGDFSFKPGMEIAIIGMATEPF